MNEDIQFYLGQVDAAKSKSHSDFLRDETRMIGGAMARIGIRIRGMHKAFMAQKELLIEQAEKIDDLLDQNKELKAQLNRSLRTSENLSRGKENAAKNHR